MKPTFYRVRYFMLWKDGYLEKENLQCCLMLSIAIYRINQNKPSGSYGPGYNVRIWNDFCQPNVHEQQISFKKTRIEDCIPHLYASFGTFCVQIGQLFAAQWDFKHSEEFRNRQHFHFNNSDLSIFKHNSKTHCPSNNWPIWLQKVPKEA